MRGALSEGNVNLGVAQFILPSSFLLASSKVSEMIDFQMFYKRTFRNYFSLKKKITLCSVKFGPIG